MKPEECREVCEEGPRGWRLRRRSAAVSVAHDAEGRAWEIIAADSVEGYLPADERVGRLVDGALKHQPRGWSPKWADAANQCGGKGIPARIVASLERGRELVRALALPVSSSRWCHSEEGYRVDVPAYCRGEDRNMLRRSRSVADAAPVRVLVSWSAPAATEASTLAERAGVLSGIVDELSAVRPVELSICNMVASDYSSLGNERHGLAVACVGVPLGDPLRVAGILGPGGARTLEVVPRRIERSANGYDDCWRNYGAFATAPEMREPVLASLGLFDAEADILIPPPHQGEDITSSNWFKRLRAMLEGRAVEAEA